MLWKWSFDKFCYFPSAAETEDVSRVVDASFFFPLAHDSLVVFVLCIKIFITIDRWEVTCGLYYMRWNICFLNFFDSFTV